MNPVAAADVLLFAFLKNPYRQALGSAQPTIKKSVSGQHHICHTDSLITRFDNCIRVPLDLLPRRHI